MTERREPRERSDRPANRQPHTPSNTNHHGHQPLPLDNNPSIWATRGSQPSAGRARSDSPKSDRPLNLDWLPHSAPFTNARDSDGRLQPVAGLLLWLVRGQERQSAAPVLRRRQSRTGSEAIGGVYHARIWADPIVSRAPTATIPWWPSVRSYAVLQPKYRSDRADGVQLVVRVWAWDASLVLPASRTCAATPLRCRLLNELSLEPCCLLVRSMANGV